jgi:nucleotide-binding universal stress UspA family protein
LRRRRRARTDCGSDEDRSAEELVVARCGKAAASFRRHPDAQLLRRSEPLSQRRRCPMNPIVLATDGSAGASAAAEEAFQLAAECQASLLVVTVWDRPHVGVGYAPLPVVVDAGATPADRARRIAEAVAARARAAGVEGEPVVRRGFPVDEICAVAQERNAQAIVIGFHHWGRVRRALHGSVANGVLRAASCPVLVVPAASALEAPATSDNRTPLEV